MSLRRCKKGKAQQVREKLHHTHLVRKKVKKVEDGQNPQKKGASVRTEKKKEKREGMTKAKPFCSTADKCVRDPCKAAPFSLSLTRTRNYDAETQGQVHKARKQQAFLIRAKKKENKKELKATKTV